MNEFQAELNAELDAENRDIEAQEKESDLSWTTSEKDLIQYQAAREREDEIANDNLRLI